MRATLNAAEAIDRAADEAKQEIAAMTIEALWEVDEILGLNELTWRRNMATTSAQNRLVADMHRLLCEAFIRVDLEQGTSSALLAKRIGRDVRKLRKLLLEPQRWKLDDFSDFCLGLAHEPAFRVKTRLEQDPIIQHLMRP